MRKSQFTIRLAAIVSGAAMLLGAAACTSSPSGPSTTSLPSVTASLQVGDIAGSGTPTTSPATSPATTSDDTTVPINTSTPLVIKTTSTVIATPTDSPVKQSEQTTETTKTTKSSTPTKTHKPAPFSRNWPAITRTITIKDPLHDPRTDPVQLAAAFVTAYLDRSSKDSMADNYSLRIGPLVTDKLHNKLYQNYPSDTLRPSLGFMYGKIVSAEVGAPYHDAKNTLRVFINSELIVKYQGKVVRDLTDTRYIVTVAWQKDGRWLVSALTEGAN